MMRRTLFVLALLATTAAPALAQQSSANHDVPWFQARPQVLEQTLQRCHRDARLAASWDCQNAEAAAASRIGQPKTPAPSPRSTDRLGLPEPDFNPRTNPLGYSNLKAACANPGQPGSDLLTPYCGQLDRYREAPSGGR
jgi:hypothetical protein